jgi:hypothetical protein
MIRTVCVVVVVVVVVVVSAWDEVSIIHID